MADWNSELYLKFKAERTQPAHDLAARIPLRDARSILDIGCGPGNSTAAVAARYPGARVLGVDSSENMVAAACAAHPEFEFRVCEAPQGLDALGGGFDIVFSNACLQWIPEHRTLLPALMRQLRPGGVLAVQIPVQQSLCTGLLPKPPAGKNGGRPFPRRPARSTIFSRMNTSMCLGS